MSEIPAMPESRQFAHDAMKTTFTLRLGEGDPARLRSVARLCFEELDLLESQLSRFVEGSDVSRINHLRAGESLFVSEACHACLLQALQLHEETGGLFDVTLGAAIEHVKSGRDGEAPVLCGSLMVDPERPLIVCHEPGRQIDLGGIGKGFALDRLQRILIDWEIDSALVSAGASTQLAHGPLPWPIELAGDHGSVTIALRGAALSASGTGIQGDHIVHPAGPRAPAGSLSFKRVWLVDRAAADADAWSTAVMLMTDEQLRELGDDRPDSLYVEDARGIRPWSAA